ncbi:uncharacterized protein B0H18DRAFT_1123326 [Fomitopsis serialis]|uniref:uncharacterized protein n=1 Tax=Fomitopsis serialis TaxID=139415 RepID=UPI0020078549|nr:uncharacterized protein B0H18DRAFT_1123326 [Neoantrodia serialis]KAH9917963.1 hypothetical protein B0H18DRAFT_1123326 [Neoantrodia serialis]
MSHSLHRPPLTTTTTAPFHGHTSMASAPANVDIINVRADRRLADGEDTIRAQIYYPFSAEEEILKTRADEIARVMHAADGGEVKLTKSSSSSVLALSGLVPPTMASPITYYALDLQERELARTLKELNASDVGAQISGKGGLEGRTGVDRVSARLSEQYKLDKTGRDVSPSSASETSSGRGSDETDETPPSTPGDHSPLHILFLGSSLGNFPRGDDAAFLQSLPLRTGSGDTLLLGLDRDNDPKDIETAYNDPQGVTEAFIMNGLKCAGKALGDEGLFVENKWAYVGRYNKDQRRHEAFYKSLEDQTIIDPVSKAVYSFKADELVSVEVSHKTVQRSEPATHSSLDRQLLALLPLATRAPFLPLLPSLTARGGALPFSMPTLDEWQTMWAAWDFITQRMIPPSMLFQKPIDLRHICLFYMGHIPTFLSIHLCRLLGEADTEPAHFKYIFERGIDPNVDDPTQCHSHSEVPTRDEDWPSVADILQYQSRVRKRIIKLYDDFESGSVVLTRKIARVMFMTLEHEAFHAETLLYMLLQRAGTGTIPPSGFTPPAWSTLTDSWDRAPHPKDRTVKLGPATITLGHDDDEADDASTDVATHEFGWDNEHPKRQVDVGAFKIEWRPVTNGEFYEYYVDKGKDVMKFPASWVEINGEVHVRTLYGPVPIKVAWHWPIITSFENLSTYASVKGGRIPTEPELRIFLDMFESGYEGGANGDYGRGARRRKGHNGGVFEWTSTILEKHEGFVPSRLYPGYSVDFFDGHHQVVIGGSYATIPRLAERRTLRNYYQHNYPYAWVGARIAYDV